MSNEAQHLLNHIQYKTGKTLEAIAKEIGYSRPHLNKAKLNGIEGGKIVGKLKSKYANELKDVPRFEEGETGKAVGNPGYIPADQVIADLRKDKEWLQAILATSLGSIIEGQQQSSIQLKALSWFSALQASSGDEKKAEEAMLKIGNRAAFYEGVIGKDRNQDEVDSGSISRKRKSSG